MIEHLDNQIESHLKFMEIIEQIRWRFTSAFGITALVGLLFLSNKIVKEDINIFLLVASCLLVVTVSIAGLITQIRIIGIFWAEWHKIRELQKYKFALVKENKSENINIPDEVLASWCLPKIVPSKLHNFKDLTVHEANCLLFSSFLGVSCAMPYYATSNTTVKPLILFVFILTVSTIVTHKTGIYYYRKIKNEAKNIKHDLS